MGRKMSRKMGFFIYFAILLWYYTSKEPSMFDEKNEVKTEFETILVNNWRTLPDPRLKYTMHLDHMEMPKYQNAATICSVLYKADSRDHRRFGSMLNAMFVQGTSIFIMTRKLMNDLLKNDENQIINSCDDIAYKLLLKFILGKGIIEQVRSPSPFGSKGTKKAGVYKLIDKRLLMELDLIVGATFRKQHEESFMIWQAATDKIDADTPLTKEEEQMVAEVKRITKEKREKREKA